MNKPAAAIRFVLIALALEAQRETGLLLEGYVRFAWPISELQSLERPPNREEVALLLTSFARGDGGKQIAVEQFRFVPLRRDGPPSLIAVSDAGGGKWFWSLQIVEPVGQLFRITGLDSAPPHDLHKELADLDGDGLYEIVTKNLAGGYQGARTRPIFVYRIYKAKDSTISDASSEFRDYYEKTVIPELEHNSDRLKERLEAGLASIDARSPEDLRAQQEVKEDLVAAKAEVQFVLDHYQRAVYRRKTAGLETALAWSQSPNSHLQLLAAQALEEMDHPVALLTLARLAKTGNLVVSGQATGALERIRRRANPTGGKR